MESPAFFVMLWLWISSPERSQITLFLFLLFFELHYFQRTFIFPFLMKGHSKMPLSIVLMGALFNTINGFLIGESLFHQLDDFKYYNSWFSSTPFVIGTIIFFVGMIINLHSDHVIRNLRKPGDTKHYMPTKGFYKYVTSANYFGELIEWVGFAILTQSDAAWIFVLWTFANLAPRAYAIRKHYKSEFGVNIVGDRKCLIPFVF